MGDGETAEPGSSQRVLTQPTLQPTCSSGGTPEAGKPSHAQHPCSQDSRSGGIVKTRSCSPRTVTIRHISTTQKGAPAPVPCITPRVLRGCATCPWWQAEPLRGLSSLGPAAPLCEASRTVGSSCCPRSEATRQSCTELLEQESARLRGKERPTAGGSVSLACQGGAWARKMMFITAAMN